MKLKHLAIPSFILGLTCLTILVKADEPIPKLNFNAQAAQTSSWSGSGYYDVKAKHLSGVVFNRIGELTIHGKPTGIEANGFVGIQDSKGTPATIGLAVLWHRQLFDQISLVFGVGGSLTGGKWGGGPILGASVRFN